MENPSMGGDRFLVVTKEDRRGTLWVVSIICCIYILMVLGLRSSARQGSYGADDWLAGMATISGVLQSIMIFVATAKGLGMDYTELSSNEALIVGRLFVASNTLILLTLLFSKGTVIYLCRRLLGDNVNVRGRVMLCNILTAASSLWCVGSIITLAVGCGPLGQLGYHTQFCSGLVTRWSIIGALDGAIEILIVGLGCLIVWPLGMPWTRKAVVLASFVPRLLLILFIVLHITKLSDATHHTTNRGAFLAIPTVYLQIDVLYAVFSAAIPPLNRWLRKSDTSMGGAWETSFNYGVSQRSYQKASTAKSGNGAGFMLKSLKSRSKDQSKSQLRSRERHEENDRLPNTSSTSKFRPEQLNYVVDVDAQSRQSQDSSGSQANIIRRDIQYTVSCKPNSPVGTKRYRDGEGTSTATSRLAD